MIDFSKSIFCCYAFFAKSEVCNELIFWENLLQWTYTRTHNQNQPSPAYRAFLFFGRPYICTAQNMVSNEGTPTYLMTSICFIQNILFQENKVQNSKVWHEILRFLSFFQFFKDFTLQFSSLWPLGSFKSGRKRKIIREVIFSYYGVTLAFLTSSFYYICSLVWFLCQYYIWFQNYKSW